MKFHYALVALAMACNDGAPGDKSGETGLTDDGCGPGGAYDGPVEITGAEVSCTGNTIRYEMHTRGLTGDGVVFSQDTANTPSWSDNHDLTSYEFDAKCNEFDRLEQEVSDGDTLNDPVNDYARNESSVFQCDDHINGPVMTYAFFALDQQGTVADCLAFGDNPQGLINGNEPSQGEDPDFPLSNCVAGSEGL